MDYIQLSFPVSGEVREILIARLSEAGCEAFEETDEVLQAFLPEDRYDAELVRCIAQDSHAEYITTSIPQQNWNAIWEGSFEPVTVPGFCTIRAAFHDATRGTPHDIIITPKMSFGTGHHATTLLMMQAMQDIDFTGKRVLDFGTGTGILAILAQKLGATDVLAIDNDVWSVENAIENVAANNAVGINVLQGSLEDVGGDYSDIILANINRHILLQYMPLVRLLLHKGGTLVLSGILTADEHIITESALSTGLVQAATFREGDWIAIKFAG